MQCESLWGGAHLVPIYTIYLWDSLALAQPAWALKPSLSLCCWLCATPSPPFTLPPSISARLPLYPADGTLPGSRTYKSFSRLLPSLLPPSRIEYLSRLGKSLLSFPVSSVQSAPPPFSFSIESSPAKGLGFCFQSLEGQSALCPATNLLWGRSTESAAICLNGKGEKEEKQGYNHCR